MHKHAVANPFAAKHSLHPQPVSYSHSIRQLALQDKFPDASLCFAMNPCSQEYLIGTTALEVDIRECRSS